MSHKIMYICKYGTNIQVHNLLSEILKTESFSRMSPAHQSLAQTLAYNNVR